jgi:hypothetical protein
MQKLISLLCLLGLALVGVCGPVEPEKGKMSAAEARRILASLEVRTLLVLPATAAKDNVYTLTVADAEAIAHECPSVVAAAPLSRTRTKAVSGDRSWVPLYICGTTPSYLALRDWKDLKEGDVFTDRDMRGGNKVCLLGQTVAGELFGKASPIGKSIRLGDMSFRVIGVLSRKGGNFAGLDQDDIVLVPLTAFEPLASKEKPGPDKPEPTARSLAGVYPVPRAAGTVDQILVRAKSFDDVAAANREITELLRKRHHIAAGQPDDINIRDYTEFKKALEERAR